MTHEEAVAKAKEVTEKLRDDLNTKIIPMNDFSAILPIDMPDGDTLFMHVSFDDAYGVLSRGYRL